MDEQDYYDELLDRAAGDALRPPCVRCSGASTEECSYCGDPLCQTCYDKNKHLCPDCKIYYDKMKTWDIIYPKP
jgi:hypothetical protein